jgi:2,3-bisphosphoglycerate-independent phosphoglycerate mutase
MSKKTVLIITDGIGHNSSCILMPFVMQKNQHMIIFFQMYLILNSHLWRVVGFQMDQMGNSEVGHMTIGSGRVLYQDLVKIHIAIEK